MSAEAEPSVLIVGGGWAGLAAAVRLCEAGASVTLLDSAPGMGGRARSQSLDLGGQSLVVDNGQHLLMGAYHRTLALRQRIGASDASLVRERLSLQTTDGIRLRSNQWPGRAGLLHGLMTAQGLSLTERLSMIRLLATLPADRDRRWPQGLTVSQWLERSGQPSRLSARIWRPLCLGALNTPPEAACARTFARVLRDTLRGAAPDSDFLQTRGPLGEVLADPAARWLRKQGAVLRSGTTARALRQAPGGHWQVRIDAGEVLQARHLVLATSAPSAARLLDSAELPPLAHALAQSIGKLAHTPIATLWMGWRDPQNLLAMVALQDTDETPGQWLFDRTELLSPSTTATLAAGLACGAASPVTGPGTETQGPAALRSLASVVVSAPTDRWQDPQSLQSAVLAQIMRELGLPAPWAMRTVIERRATPCCTPDRLRLEPHALQSACPGLWLAGDWVFHAYPGTLEGAVRSGEAAAQRILGH